MNINIRSLFNCISLIILVIMLCGCGNKVNLSLDKGNIQVICSSGNLGDAVIITKSSLEANYNKNKEIINYKTITTEINKDEKTFKERKKMYDQIYKNIKSDENTIYDYNVNIRKKEFIITTVYKKIDLKLLGEDEQNRFNLKEFIKSYEDNSYKCKIKGIKRSDI